MEKSDVLNNNLTLCQCEFICNRTYDKQENVIKYFCDKENMGIKVFCNSTTVEDICSMDKKALNAIIPHCTQKCQQPYNSYIER